MSRYQSLEVRFWSKVEKGPLCWNWRGANVMGYGSIFYNGKTRRATHIAWEMERGPIPKGLFVLHECDNPSCVRVEHLSLGTQSKNMKDCFKRHPHKNVGYSRKTHCIKGHELIESNVYRTKEGHRECRICKLHRMRKFHESRKKVTGETK